MELRPGYKQTEVGVIPEDWTVVPFQQLFDFRNGINADSRAYGKGVAFINVFEIISKGHLKAQDIPGRVSIDKKSIESYLVRRGDIVFNRSSETQDEVGLSSVYLDDAPAVFGGFVIRGQCKQALDPVYSGYAFRAPAIRTQIVARGQGAIRANIGQFDLKQIHAPLPSLDEQGAIAEALSDADALIESLDQFITKKRQIKQGAMQELLTGKRRLPGFSGGWDVKRLGDIAKIQRGASPRPIDSPVWFDNNSMIGWVRISDVTSSSMYLQETTQRLSALGVQYSRPVKRGSLIMSICATVGRPVITEIDTCIHDGFVVFDDLAVEQRFLYYFLKFIENDWAKHGQTGSQMNLNTPMINRTSIPAPPIEEQSAIATVLGDIDTELSALESRLAKARQIKQGMMQELLTGRIRLL